MTTAANKAMSAVHDRMPVVLTSDNAALAWIKENDRETLDELIQPGDNNTLVFTQVSEYVNKSTHEGAQCIEPV